MTETIEQNTKETPPRVDENIINPPEIIIEEVKNESDGSTEIELVSIQSTLSSPAISRSSSLDNLVNLESPAVSASPSLENFNELPLLHKKLESEAKPAPPKKSEKRQYIENVLLSLVYAATFIAYGAAGSSLNWSSEKLEYLTGMTKQELGVVLALRGAGYIIGNLLSGKIYGILSHGPEVKNIPWYKFTCHKFYVCAVLGLGLFMAIIPFSPNVLALYILYLIFGIFQGFVETGACSFLIWIWKLGADPWVLFIQFTYGLGSLLSPLIASPFLSDNPTEFLGTRIAHWIITVLCIATVLPFPFFNTPRTTDKKILEQFENKKEDEKEKEEKKKKTKWINEIIKRFWPPSRASLIVLLCGIFVLFSTGCYIAYTGLLYQYARMKDIADPQNAALLTSGVWASITVGRLLSTVLSTVLDTRIILFFGLTFSAVGLAIMMIYANLITVWIGSVVLGVAMAPLYPAIIAFPQTLGVQTTSSMTAFIIAMGGTGSMIIPLGVTSLFEVIGPESLFYLVLLCVVGSSVAFVIMLVAFRTKRNPNEKTSWYSFLFKKRDVEKD